MLEKENLQTMINSKCHLHFLLLPISFLDETKTWQLWTGGQGSLEPPPRAVWLLQELMAEVEMLAWPFSIVMVVLEVYGHRPWEKCSHDASVPPHLPWLSALETKAQKPEPNLNSPRPSPAAKPSQGVDLTNFLGLILAKSFIESKPACSSLLAVTGQFSASLKTRICRMWLCLWKSNTCRQNNCFSGLMLMSSWN